VKKSLKEIGKEKEKEGKREKIIKKHYLLFTLEEKKKKKKIYFAYSPGDEKWLIIDKFDYYEPFTYSIGDALSIPS
jgi:hypothetical protein